MTDAELRAFADKLIAAYQLEPSGDYDKSIAQMVPLLSAEIRSAREDEHKRACRWCELPNRECIRLAEIRKEI